MRLKRHFILMVMGIMMLSWRDWGEAAENDEASYGFKVVKVIEGLQAPTRMEFAPDGRLFICEQTGVIRVVKDGMLLPDAFHQREMYWGDGLDEAGLLGIAFHPEFETNGHVYIYYTTPVGLDGTARNRVSRLTAEGDLAVPDSEVVILDGDPLTFASFHNAGDIHFGPDGKLYVAVGDNFNADNAQVITNLMGKILRINSDGSIPADNPFFKEATGVNRAIWALGLRNPYTFAFSLSTGRMFINDVGLSTWEEINEGVAGGNYGWPLAEGNGTNVAHRNPLYAYRHWAEEFSGCAITAGVFYEGSTNQYRPEDRGNYFFADYCGGWVQKMNPETGQVSPIVKGVFNPVDVKVGPDGLLYCLSRTWEYYGGVVYRIDYGSPHDIMVTSGEFPRGSNVTVRATAQGKGPFSYQWTFNGENLIGATDSAFVITNLQPARMGNYAVMVANELGTATSTNAQILIRGVPFIFLQPKTQSVVVDSNVLFSVRAAGSVPLFYQWRYKGTNIVGATNDTLELGNLQLSDAGRYSVVITNSYGSTVSADAILTVNVFPPRFVVPPKSKKAPIGFDTSFHAQVSGTPPLYYQWRYNGKNIADATSDTLELTNLQLSNTGRYSVVVTNRYGSIISSNAVLTVHPLAPSFVVPPEPQVTSIGLDISFHVEVSGTPPIRYQWQFNGTNLSGATDFDLSLTNLQLRQSGKYRVIASNAGGTRVSPSADLKIVTCRYSIKPQAIFVGYFGASFDLEIVSHYACPWWVLNTNEWLSPMDVSGIGNPFVTFNASRNTGATSRKALIQAVGQQLLVVQAGEPVPTALFGKTLVMSLETDSEESMTNELQLVILSPGTNASLRRISAQGIENAESYTFTRINETNVKLGFNSFTAALSFTSARRGGFVFTNENVVRTGSFTMVNSAADFDGDVRPDLVWQNDNGSVAAWVMEGTNFVGSVPLRNGLAAGVGWKIAGQSDFDGDGNWDLLWQHDNGQLGLWLMDGTNMLGSQFLRDGTSAGSWRAKGLSDFNADGQVDVLFQNPEGKLAVWYLSGTNFQGGAVLRDGLAASAGWSVVGVADFNGDGQGDILFQHDNGRLALWLMTGSDYVMSEFLRQGQPVVNWRAAALADMDQDGQTDIIFQDIRGQAAVWLMSEKEFLESKLLRNGQPVPSGWRLVGPK